MSEISRTALGYDFPPEDTQRRLDAVIGNPTHFLLAAADEDDMLVGYIHACSYDSLFYEPLKYVIALAVDPAHQGKGMGRALLEACEEWARAEGAMGVRLASGADRTAAHAFYRHLGYMERKTQKSIWKVFSR